MHTSSPQKRVGSSISVGDIIAMKITLKRMFWRLALMEELLMESDGHVHAVTVRPVKSGEQGQLF